MNEATIKNAIKNLRDNGETREPLHLYASNDEEANRWKSSYPGVEIHIVPKTYLPTNTEALLTGEDYDL